MNPLPGTAEQAILAFAESRWGERTWERLGNKLAEEGGEVNGAVVKIEEGRASLSDLDDELGDVLIVISQFAAKRGKTIEQLRAARFDAVRRRAEPSQNGAAGLQQHCAT